MNNTLRYERGNRGLIPFGGTNCFNVSNTNSDLTFLYFTENVRAVVQDLFEVY